MSEQEETKQEETTTDTQEKSSPKVELRRPVMEEAENGLTQDQEDILRGAIALSNVDEDELNRLAQDYPKIESGTGAIGQRWVRTYLEAINHLYKGKAFTGSVDREGGQWRQGVEHEGDFLTAGKPRFGSDTGGVISGEGAVIKVTNALGLGSVVQIPLWHTGIWITLKAPSEGKLLELERRMAQDKGQLGRYTAGMVFSNNSVYRIHHLINFILDHVLDASVPSLKPDALKNIIKVPDLQTLAWGMACAIYPNGYNYARACTTNPSVCQHVVEGKLNLSKMQWTDNDSLSAYQRKHMSRRQAKFTEEEVKKYQDEHVRGGHRLVSVGENLKFRLKVPTLAQYEQSGFSWVDGITSMADGSLGVTLRGKERDDYLLDQARITALRQYAHWVHSIEIHEVDNVGNDRVDTIKDEESIDVILGNLSNAEEIRTDFFNGVGNYIDDSAISVVAVPKYDCPSCGEPASVNTGNEFHPYLLPIDVVEVFFTLLDQRMFKVLTKATL